MSILHISPNQVSIPFQVWNNKGTSYTEYSVTARGSNGYQWQINKLASEKSTILMNLKMNPLTGLVAAIAVNTSSKKESLTSINPEVLLQQVQYNAGKDIPCESNLNGRGSILLLVAIKATESSTADEKGINLNAATNRVKLTEKNWIDAYLEVEKRFNLPEYLREQFIKVMAELKFPVSFPTAATPTAATPTAATVTQLPTTANNATTSQNSTKQKQKQQQQAA